MSTLKFVGTVSLGLLTGISYTTSTVTLPTLALLPSAASARRTLTALQQTTTRHALSLASISSISLLTSFFLAPARARHPYLLYTALVSFVGGQGVEFWFNGISRWPRIQDVKASVKAKGKGKGKNGGSEDWEDVGSSSVTEASLNGESVERDMGRERWIQAVRTGIAGLGFFMGVVGLWGDGA